MPLNVTFLHNLQHTLLHMLPVIIAPNTFRTWILSFTLVRHFYYLLRLIKGLADQEEVIFKFLFDFWHLPAFCSVTRQQHYRQTHCHTQEASALW